MPKAITTPSAFKKKVGTFFKVLFKYFLLSIRSLKNSPAFLKVFLLGSVAFLGFAPFSQAYILPFLLWGFFSLLGEVNSKIKKAFLGWVFVFSWSFFGVHWLYYSAYHYSELTFFQSLALPLVVSLFQGFYGAFCFAFASNYGNHWLRALRLAALWMLMEWMRSWNFTGMPWLWVGTAFTNTPLVSWASIFGALGLGFFTAFSSALWAQKRILPVASTLVLWVLFIAFKPSTDLLLTRGPTLKTLALQYNNPVETRFDIHHEKKLSKRYIKRLNRINVPIDAVLMAETTLGVLDVPKTEKPWISALERNPNIGGVILGLTQPSNRNNQDPDPMHIRTTDQFWGVLLGFIKNREGALEKQTYFKSKMVPFGEFTPSFFTWLNQWFHLPLSQLESKRGSLQAFELQRASLIPLLCYESVSPFLMRKGLQSTKLPSALIFPADDTWFGRTIEGEQAVQIAAIRAAEAGRYAIRISHTGPSVLISPRGEVLYSLALDKVDEKILYLPTRSGQTPYILMAPFYLILLVGFLLWDLWRRTQPIQYLLQKTTKLEGRKFKKNVKLWEDEL